MTAPEVLARGRVAAEALMLDACTVHRPGAVVTDPDTGVAAPSLTLVYTGKCKVQQTLAQSSNPEASGHAFTVLDTRWDTPVGAGPFVVDDVITMTVATEDADLVGQVFRFKEPFHKSLATAQRARVEAVVA